MITPLTVSLYLAAANPHQYTIHAYSHPRLLYGKNISPQLTLRDPRSGPPRSPRESYRIQLRASSFAPPLKVPLAGTHLKQEMSLDAGSSKGKPNGIGRLLHNVDLDGHDMPPSPASSSPHSGKRYALATELVYTESNDKYNASSGPIYQVCIALVHLKAV